MAAATSAVIADVKLRAHVPPVTSRTPSAPATALTMLFSQSNMVCKEMLMKTKAISFVQGTIVHGYTLF